MVLIAILPFFATTVPGAGLPAGAPVLPAALGCGMLFVLLLLPVAPLVFGVDGLLIGGSLVADVAPPAGAID